MANPVRRLDADLKALSQATSAQKKAEAAKTSDAKAEASALAGISQQEQAIVDQFQSATPPTGAQAQQLLLEVFTLGEQAAQTKDQFGAKLAGDQKAIAKDGAAEAKWKKRGRADLLPAEYYLGLKATNRARAALGLKPVTHVIRPPAKGNVLPGSAGRLSGIDFSSNNFGHDSVRQAAAAFEKDIRGQQYAFVKATEGTGYKNPYFASQWKILGERVKKGQMALRVAYHFLTPGTEANGVAQAKDFLRSVGVHGKLPAGTRLALDWEAGALGTPGVLKGAADYIHHVTGIWPIVYTSSGNEAVATRMVPHAPRWEANYGPHYRGINDRGGKILPSKRDVFDQYSDGRGYGRPYDLNVFNGTLAALRKFAGF